MTTREITDKLEDLIAILIRMGEKLEKNSSIFFVRNEINNENRT